MRYEDLVADPVGEIGKIYERAGPRRLSAGAAMRSRVAVGQQKDYKTNKHELDEALKATDSRAVGGLFRAVWILAQLA